MMGRENIYILMKQSIYIGTQSRLKGEFSQLIHTVDEWSTNLNACPLLHKDPQVHTHRCNCTSLPSTPPTLPLELPDPDWDISIIWCYSSFKSPLLDKTLRKRPPTWWTTGISKLWRSRGRDGESGWRARTKRYWKSSSEWLAKMA